MPWGKGSGRQDEFRAHPKRAACPVAIICGRLENFRRARAARWKTQCWGKRRDTMLDAILAIAAMIVFGFVARSFSLVGEGAEKELSNFV